MTEHCYTCGRSVGAEHTEGCPRRRLAPIYGGPFARVTALQARWTWTADRDPEIRSRE